MMFNPNTIAGKVFRRLMDAEIPLSADDQKLLIITIQDEARIEFLRHIESSINVDCKEIEERSLNSA